MTNLKMRPSTRQDASALYQSSPDEITSRISAMQHQQDSYATPDYLSKLFATDLPFQSEHVDSRSKMCHWCYQLADITTLSRLAVSRAMNYLDRYVSCAATSSRAKECLLSRREYQLAAMTCLYISVKLYEPLAMDASLLAEISAGCYSTCEIIDMEKSILDVLRWKMNGSTAHEFVCNLLGLLDPADYYYDLDTVGSILDVSLFQCEMAATDYELGSMKCSPSYVALGAVLNSLEGTTNDLMGTNERCRFVSKILDTLDEFEELDMNKVHFVQGRLRHLFCQNSGVELERQHSSSLTDVTHVPQDEEDSSSSISKNLKDTRRQQPKDVSPISPVSVTDACESVDCSIRSSKRGQQQQQRCYARCA